MLILEEWWQLATGMELVEQICALEFYCRVVKMKNLIYENKHFIKISSLILF